MTSVTPPRLAEQLLRWSLSRSERPAVLGDLQEEFDELATASDPKTAARWYWRQTITSVGPNLARAFRHQLFLVTRVVNDADRRSRRWRLGIGASIFAAGLTIGRWLVHTRHDPDWFENIAPFLVAGILVTLTATYRAMPFSGRSRRGRIANALYWLSVPFTFAQSWTGHPLSIAAEMLRYGIWSLCTLFWMWPSRTWPFHRERTDELSLRAPVLQPWTRDKYETVTVAPLPAALSEVVVGRPRSEPDAPSGPSLMNRTTDRVFSADETIRLFVVLNARPDDVHASLEIRRASTGRVIGTLPAAVRSAVPMRTAKQQAGRDPDDEPLMPTPTVASEIDVTLSLAGLAPDAYVLRLVTVGPDGASYQRVPITVRTPGDRS